MPSLAPRQYRIRIYGTPVAGDRFSQPVFLCRYEPGEGLMEFTEDASEAKLFPDFKAATQEWLRIDERYPLRLDGRPNRPLSAFTVGIEPAENEAALDQND